jgi:hypothetical protein
VLRTGGAECILHAYALSKRIRMLMVQGLA